MIPERQLEKLVDGYWRYWRDQTESNFPGWNEVADLVLKDAESGWQITLALLRSAVDDLALMYIAAGPLEDLLVHHGQRVWPEIVAMARRETVVRRALKGVWGHTSMDRAIAAELIQIQRDSWPTAAPHPPHRIKR